MQKIDFSLNVGAHPGFFELLNQVDSEQQEDCILLPNESLVDKKKSRKEIRSFDESELVDSKRIQRISGVSNIRLLCDGVDVDDPESSDEMNEERRMRQRLRILEKDFKIISRASSHNYSRIEIVEKLRGLKSRVDEFVKEAEPVDREKIDRVASQLLRKIDQKIERHIRAHREYQKAINIYNNLERAQSPRAHLYTSNDMAVLKRGLNSLHKWTKEDCEVYLFADKEDPNRGLFVVYDNKQVQKWCDTIDFDRNIAGIDFNALDVDLDRHHVILREMPGVSSKANAAEEYRVNDRFWTVSLVIRDTVGGSFDPGHGYLLIETYDETKGYKIYIGQVTISPLNQGSNVFKFFSLAMNGVHTANGMREFYDPYRLTIEFLDLRGQSPFPDQFNSQVYKSWSLPRKKVECLIERIKWEIDQNNSAQYRPMYFLGGRDDSADRKHIRQKIESAEERYKYFEDDKPLDQDDLQLLTSSEVIVPGENCQTWAIQKLRGIGIENIARPNNFRNIAAPRAWRQNRGDWIQWASLCSLAKPCAPGASSTPQIFEEGVSTASPDDFASSSSISIECAIEESEEYYIKGEEAERAGNWRQAAQNYTIAARLGCPDAREAAGLTYYKQGEILESQGDLHGAAKSYWNSTDFGNVQGMEKYGRIQFQFGLMDKEKKNFAQAIVCFERAKIADPSNGSIAQQQIAECYLEMGMLYKNKEDLDRAITYFEKANKIHSTAKSSEMIAACFFELGLRCKKDKELNQAVQNFEVLAAYPEDVEAEPILALLREQALVEIKECRQMIAENFFEQGVAFERVEDFDSAKRCYEQAQELNHPKAAERLVYCNQGIFGWLIHKALAGCTKDQDFLS